MRQYLVPSPEREEAFRREIQRLSQSGLKTLGAVELGGPILTFLVLFLLQPEDALRGGHMRQLAPLALVGVVTSAVARLERTRRHARVVALFSALSAACVLIWASAAAEPINEASQYIPTGVTILMLTMVAALPLRPMHALALGLGIEAVYACAEMALAAEPYATALIGPPHHTFIVILTLLSTGVAAVLYAQRRSDFFSHQEALRATEALTGAQLRAQLAENAAAIGKLAAALTHEINSPWGRCAAPWIPWWWWPDGRLRRRPKNRPRWWPCRRNCGSLFSPPPSASNGWSSGCSALWGWVKRRSRQPT